jgi:hypothetical protein
VGHGLFDSDGSGLVLTTNQRHQARNRVGFNSIPIIYPPSILIAIFTFRLSVNTISTANTLVDCSTGREMLNLFKHD